jgi:hypothetical protein
MAGKKKSTKELYWLELVARQADSGLSIRQFCAEVGVSEPSFYAWRRKLRGRRNGPGRIRTSGEPTEQPSIDGEFIPLTLIDASGELELIHPRGYRIRLTGEVNATSLQGVLDVLDGRSHG